MPVPCGLFVAFLLGSSFGGATSTFVEVDQHLDAGDAVSLLQIHAQRRTQTGTHHKQRLPKEVELTSSRELPWKVQVTGRYKFGEDGSSISFDQDGVKFSARFSGVETLSVAMSAGCDESCARVGFVAWCDGELVAEPGLNAFTVDVSKRAIPVCSGLDPHTEHTVIILKNTATCCPVEFAGFGDAELLDPPPLPTRRIEYIGDSLTAGGFLMCNNESYALGFAEQSCEMLQADCHTTAQSGRGLTTGKDYGSRNIRDYWEDMLWTRGEKWDFSSWIPDAVVVNLGTNDEVGLSQVVADSYKASYLEWLTHVNEVYESKATFFLACGPMVLDYCPIVEEIIDEASRQGVRASFLNMTGEGLPLARQRNLHMCYKHPNPKGHEFMAKQVVEILREKLGWA